MKSKMFLSLSFALLALMAAATTISAQSPPFKFWTTVGSAGTVDEADQNKVVYSGGIVAFPELLAPPTNLALAPNLPLETVQAVIRYNVTAVDGLFEPGARLCMQTRFRDDGDRARVLLRLVEYNIFTGVTTTRLTFDSNTVPAQANFQTNSASTNWTTFDFFQNAYYVEAVLTKQQPIITPFGGGRPGLGIIQISKCSVF
ncbi:MAG: hypothetical protein L0312_29945 [Acidobacteria bacterium]|nr:hypothetical protein [Acidobacteriota bacterium]